MKTYEKNVNRRPLNIKCVNVLAFFNLYFHIWNISCNCTNKKAITVAIVMTVISIIDDPKIMKAMKVNDGTYSLHGM